VFYTTGPRCHRYGDTHRRGDTDWPIAPDSRRVTGRHHRRWTARGPGSDRTLCVFCIFRDRDFLAGRPPDRLPGRVGDTGRTDAVGVEIRPTASAGDDTRREQHRQHRHVEHRDRAPRVLPRAGPVRAGRHVRRHVARVAVRRERAQILRRRAQRVLGAPDRTTAPGHPNPTPSSTASPGRSGSHDRSGSRRK